MTFEKETALGMTTISLSMNSNIAKFPPLKMAGYEFFPSVSTSNSVAIKTKTGNSKVYISPHDREYAKVTICLPEGKAVGEILISDESYENIRSYIDGRLFGYGTAERFAEKFATFTERKKDVKTAIRNIMKMADDYAKKAALEIDNEKQAIMDMF